MELFIKKYMESRERLMKRLQIHEEEGNDQLFTQVKNEIEELDVNFYSIQQQARILFETLPSEEITN